MKIFWSLLCCLIALNTYGQNSYEQSMSEAMKGWTPDKNLEAMQVFEKIAKDHPKEWLPRYYQTLSGIRASFQIKDQKTKVTLLDSLSKLLPKEPEDLKAEWHILNALMLTADLISDPMANGMTLTPQIIFYYNRALALEPNNPRALAGLAEFNLNYKRFMGGDTKEDCSLLKKSIALFNEQKNETLFYPSWGKERAMELLSNCK